MKTAGRAQLSSPSVSAARPFLDHPTGDDGAHLRRCHAMAPSAPPDANRLIQCAQPTCRASFVVCVRCDHGRRFCSKACADSVRRAQSRMASRTYQRTERGRALHAARQARYRDRCRSRVTHQSGVAPSKPGGDEPSPRVDEGARARSPDEPQMAALPPPTSALSAPSIPAAHPPSCAFCGRETVFLRLWRARRRPPIRRRRRGQRAKGPRCTTGAQ